jgi:hypothetical protein
LSHAQRPPIHSVASRCTQHPTARRRLSAAAPDRGDVISIMHVRTMLVAAEMPAARTKCNYFKDKYLDLRRRSPYLAATPRIFSTLSSADLWIILFEASQVLHSRPTLHTFLDSSVSSNSRRGRGFRTTRARSLVEH